MGISRKRHGFCLLLSRERSCLPQTPGTSRCVSRLGSSSDVDLDLQRKMKMMKIQQQKMKMMKRIQKYDSRDSRETQVRTMTRTTRSRSGRSLSVSLDEEQKSSVNGGACVQRTRRKLYNATPRHVLLVRSCLPRSGAENQRTRESRTDCGDRKKLFRHFTVGSFDSIDSTSDCVTEQRTVILQKQDNEGFGFVLRGAKADTPIEEFVPTAAFPALQYLESVDEGGAAWRTGLRSGDFLTEVNQQNVVKMGHPPPPPKRAPTTALSMRSKSMTSELEELDKAEEAVHPQKLMKHENKVEKTVSIKTRPKGRFMTVEFNQGQCSEGVAGVPPNVPERAHGSCIRVQKSSMKRQKSIGIAGEEKKRLIPPLVKFSRSLSMPDTSEDIPPPPGISPPSPPYKMSVSIAQTYEPNHSIYTENRCHTIERDMLGHHRQNFDSYDCSTHPGISVHNRTHVPENPYLDAVSKTLYIPPKPVRRKGILVKQPNVEDSPEKTCSISIPTIIVKEPSTSSSGKSSRGSSMENESSVLEGPGQLRPEGGYIRNPFAAAIAGAVRNREKRLEARKNSPAFLSMDLGDEDPLIPPPRLRQSVSVDEGLYESEKNLQDALDPQIFLMGSSLDECEGNTTDFTIPVPRTEPLTARSWSHPESDRFISLDGDLRTQRSGKAHSHLSLVLGQTGGVNRAQKDQVPVPPPRGEPQQGNLNHPLFIDTKLQSNAKAAAAQQKDYGGSMRPTRESTHHLVKAIETNPSEQMKNAYNLSKQTCAGLLMVQTQDKNKSLEMTQSDAFKQEESLALGSTPNDSNIKKPNPDFQLKSTPVEPSVGFTCNIPPPVLSSLDLDEDFDLTEPVPPPLEFANSIDVPEDQVAEILKQNKNNKTRGAVSIYHSHSSTNSSCLVSYTGPHTYPPPPPEILEMVTDSGIEENDSRNSTGDHRFEGNSTLSTVSSISTLSSEGIEDACMAYANGCILLDRPPVPPKPKSKPISKSNVFFRDSLKQESVESIGEPPPAPPPPLRGVIQSEPHKTQGKHHHELSNTILPNEDPKANWLSQTSESKSSTVTSIHSPPTPRPESARSSSLPGSVNSPTLTDVFSLPSPPTANADQCLSLSSVSSRSLTPLTMFNVDKPFIDKPVLLWTRHDVVDWLQSLSLAEHTKAFLENEIEGAHLPNLTKEDLMDLGVTRVGHRMNIEKALKLLMER
ncbi:hypothetical protein DNTS_000441 [Danionella cerebrum]|uniref:SAM domain-containing protein n=1 Tax=Danionella cerebrum TaxID=2873325 RepID=A0A553QZT8_9TELE|nr:hypothetical protein DNTS_000441 [Danionella translucida]